MVTSWRRRRGSPETARRQRIEHDGHAALLAERHEHRGSLGGDVAEVERNPVQLDDARIGPGQQQHVLDEGGHVPNFGLYVADRLTHVLDPAAPVAFQILDARSNDGEWRPQFVAGIRRELALALQGRLPAIDRLPDRDESAAGVEVPGGESGEKRSHAPDEQDQEQGRQKRDFGADVLDELDEPDPGRGRRAPDPDVLLGT